MVENEELEANSTEKQDAMSFLRERYLFLLSSISGKNCNVRMYENTQVSCQIKAFDANTENVIVENLQTPLPEPIKKANLRTTDIISINFNCDREDLFK